jgi:hypothetical protein
MEPEESIQCMVAVSRQYVIFDFPGKRYETKNKRVSSNLHISSHSLLQTRPKSMDFAQIEEN